MEQSPFLSIAADVRLGKDVRLSKFINLYGCEIGDETKIGACVEIQKGVTVGRRCKISSHTFICEDVTIEDHVFIGHGVTFTNDVYPRATTAVGPRATSWAAQKARTSLSTVRVVRTTRSDSRKALVQYRRTNSDRGSPTSSGNWTRMRSWQRETKRKPCRAFRGEIRSTPV